MTLGSTATGCDTARKLRRMAGDELWEPRDGEPREVCGAGMNPSHVALTIGAELLPAMRHIGSVTGANGGYVLSRIRTRF